MSSTESPDATISPSASNGSIQERNDVTQRETGSDSTPDLIHKANLPVLLIGGGGEDEEEEEVKSKVSKTHTRGSSISSAPGSNQGYCETNTTTTTNSSSSSLTNSFYSNDGPLSQVMNTSGDTSSDPILMLAANLSEKAGGASGDDTVSRLVQEVVTLKLEVMKLREENEKLQRTRSDMDEELHTLTENLFEEAYKMVDEAKGERFTAEKRLADATGQLEAMETQVSTLHSLLKTPSKSSPSQKHKRSSVKKMMKKVIRKTHSSSKPKDHPLVMEHKGNTKEWILKEGELPSCDYSSFKKWFDEGLPTAPTSDSYYNTILTFTILPCIQFKNKQLSDQLHEAIKNSTCIIEPIINNELSEEKEEEVTPTAKRRCELSGEDTTPCSYQMRLSDKSVWHYISSNCRERIVSVCDFYTFIGYLQKGIIKKEANDVYWRIAKFRAVMNLSVLSLSLPDSLP